ncbi:hypothetical protein JTB14_029119 [Gonioctena quinquepunctata]|nr:hypothetical protein JTB14_029119 [Gonioctena quinquepunctata]
MKCLKINFRASDRWIVCGESAIEIITEEDTSIIIKDKDFTEVDEDVLEFFCKSREEPYLRVFLTSDSTESFAPPLGRLSAILPVADFNIENGIKDAEIIFEDIGRSMTPSLSTTSSLSTLSNHYVIREEASPESDLSDIEWDIENNMDIQKCIVRGGGQYIIDQYNKNKMLTDRCRIQLVNIVANILFEKFGTAVPKSGKMEYAKKLVEAFPTYRNLESSCGGYEIFFNPLTNGGYLANRLRTLNRIHKVEGTSSKSLHQIKANHSPVRNETTIIPDDLDEKLKDSMTTPSTEKEKIKKPFLETHSFRKNLTNKTARVPSVFIENLSYFMYSRHI